MIQKKYGPERPNVDDSVSITFIDGSCELASWIVLDRKIYLSSSLFAGMADSLHKVFRSEQSFLAYPKEIDQINQILRTFLKNDNHILL